MWKRVILGIALVVHGLAHAGPGIWAASRGPVEAVSFLWWIATLGFVIAGFRVLGWPAPSLHPLVPTVTATGASLALLPFVGLEATALVGAVLSIGLAMLVLCLTRDCALFSPSGAVLRSGDSHAARRGRTWHRVGVAVAAMFLLHISATILLRPWHMGWGTTAAQRAGVVPGDELMPDARYVMDHAVQINAPADSVWRWLVQIGQDSGGFYSYGWLERLVGDDVHNADRVVPEWQQLAVGDLVRAAHPGYLGGVFGRDIGWRVARVEHGRALVLENWGSFVVHRTDTGRCVLHIRTRGGGRPSLGNVALAPAGLLVFEPIHFMMERRMLLGIRDRAEAGYQPASRAGRVN
jgi:hypothetical protein